MPATLCRIELRKHLRAARKALTHSQQQHAAKAIARQLENLTFYQHAKTVAGYLANDGEPELTETIAQCWQNKKQTTLPVLHPFSKKHLLFLRYCATTPMQFNRFNIAEPVLSATDICLLNQHDIILMPLVGFDVQGNRLGMGGGFYDRTLSALDPNHRPVLIGIAHDCHKVDTLPTASWDIPCDYIVTPSMVQRNPGCATPESHLHKSAQ